METEQMSKSIVEALDGIREVLERKTLFENKDVVEALDRIRGALAPHTPPEDSESVIVALDRIYEVLTSSGSGSARYQDSPTTDEET